MKLYGCFFWVALLLVFLPKEGFSQNSGIEFRASELQSKALELTGSTQNWPVLMRVAEHDKERNIFFIQPDDLLRLKNFSSVTGQVNDQKRRVSDLLKNGAAIFASENLEKVQAALKEYDLAVKDGLMDEASGFYDSILPKVNALETQLYANRLVEIQAQLKEKSGRVEKRKGLLSSWISTFIGDMFKESDGLKTYKESYAGLTFVDGTMLIVNPNTEAIIRKSRIDKLDESSDTEITLNEGGLLAKLSSLSKEKGTFILKAGEAESSLKSQNFYAEADARARASFSNYDGFADISANDITVSIQKNEGTIVEPGQAPLPPVKLLSAPKGLWARADTVVYSEPVLFAYEPVQGAVSYKVLISEAPDFSHSTRDIETAETSVFIRNLVEGINYLQVQAVDKLGLKGPFSNVFRIIKNKDTQPPPVFLKNLNVNRLFVTQNRAVIEGVTEASAMLTIGETSVKPKADGSFSAVLELSETITPVVLEAKDASSNVTIREFQIIHLKQEQLFDIKVNGVVINNKITARGNVLILSGKAYQGLEVIIRYAGETRVIRTDTNGNWGITLPKKSGTIEVELKLQGSDSISLKNEFQIDN